MSEYISVDISIDEVLDNMDNRDKKDLAVRFDLDSIRDKIEYGLTARQVLYVLREYKVDLKKLRNEILEHYPIKADL